MAVSPNVTFMAAFAEDRDNRLLHMQINIAYKGGITTTIKLAEKLKIIASTTSS